MFLILFVSTLFASTIAAGKQKRQLFREHVLPERGGKIPDEAFEQSRLVLNRLSQNGLYYPDGYHLAQRHPVSHYPRQYHPYILKVPLYTDNRYVAPPGQYHAPQTVDTTYIRRPSVNYVLLPPVKQYTPVGSLPIYSLRLLREYKYGKV